MKDDHSLLIEPILAEQAADLSDLCHKIYPQYFTYLWDDGGVWYLDHSYSPEKLKTELNDPTVRYFWAVAGGKRVGYLKLNLSKGLPQSQDTDGMEIERIYFLSEAAGRGFGSRLIEYAEAVARDQQKAYVWLHVMDSSLASMAFYRKRGFTQVGETILPFPQMKPRYRRMWQLKKPLG